MHPRLGVYKTHTILSSLPPWIPRLPLPMDTIDIHPSIPCMGFFWDFPFKIPEHNNAGSSFRLEPLLHVPC